MGNCQAVDAATLIIQHPNGKSDKLYSPVNASEIMKTNPGHYVALLLSTTLYPNPTNIINPNKTTTTPSSASTTAAAVNNSSLRITRIKLLRPTDTLLLGHAYRLITTQEVTKGLCAKKQAKLNKNQGESGGRRITENQQISGGVKRSQLQKDFQVSRTTSSSERNRGRTTSSTTTTTGSNSVRSRTWQPALNSISEGGGS